MTSSFLPRRPEPANDVSSVVNSAGVTAHPTQAAQGQQLDIDVADWNVLFTAVTTRLRHSVGERLGCPPEVPAHSAALAASLVQAVVLDCASALDRLHTALKQERSQRPTP